MRLSLKKQWNYVVQAKSLMKADIQSRIGAEDYGNGGVE